MALRVINPPSRLLFCGLAILSACSEGDNLARLVREEKFPGTHPFQSIEIMRSLNGDEIYARLEDGTSLRDVMDMSIFSDFLPNISSEDQIRQLGRPYLKRRKLNAESYAFQSERGKIVYSLESSTSAGAAWMWRLMAYPKANAVKDWVPAGIIGQVAESAPYTSVVLLQRVGEPRVEIMIKEARVESIEWIP